jgi:hypothetical protein
MARLSLGIGFLALAFGLSIGAAASASSGFSGYNDQHPSLSHVRYTREFAAQSRPRVTIHPRRSYPGPNAKRYCRSWLAKEYRVSGPVIVPHMHCWWQ